MDNKGQLSLEYILSSIIIILIISLISIPFLSIAMDYSMDVVNSMNAKNELSKITNAIDLCYHSGRGSKRLVLVDFNKESSVHFSSNANGGLAIINFDLSNIADNNYKDDKWSNIGGNNRNGNGISKNVDNNSVVKTNKKIIVEYDYKGLNSMIHFSKGFNKVLVEWDEKSELIEISRVI